MDSEGWIEKGLFSIGEKETDEIGLQYDSFLGVIYFVLEGWCSFEGKRQLGEHDLSDRLSSFAFDKLAVGISRIWNEIFHISDKKDLSGVSNRVKLASSERQGMTFVCPFQEHMGTAGRGLTIVHPNGQVVFLPKLLYQFQQNNLPSYFNVTPPDSDPENPSSYKATIEPSQPITVIDEIKRKYTSREFEVMKELEHAFKRLTPLEIQALGTHHNLNKTIQDIDWEFRCFNEAIFRILDKISNGNIFIEDSNELWFYADQAIKKSSNNRTYYRNAWFIVNAELKDPIVASAFKKIQADDKTIWENAQIKERADNARLCLAVANYIRQLSLYYKNPKRIRQVSSLAIVSFKESCEKLNQYIRNKIPVTLETTFDTNPGGELNPTAKSLLISELGTIRIKS